MMESNFAASVEAPITSTLHFIALGRRATDQRRSMKTLKQGSLVVTIAFSAFFGCGRPEADSRIYQLGHAEGLKHTKERPASSLMVFPAEWTNWTASAKQTYRSGYMDGLGGK